ncbi:type I DNA topoisomerase [Patescibacteria group bacterium]|nr:type I DNA topoisomerase [Patescibacteria group bacterium]
MKIIVVESPTKAKTITRYLGKEYEVMATTGHIRDLIKGKLGVEVENNFKPVYDLVEGKDEVVKKLKSVSKKAESIYLATDPDREGEAIAFHVLAVMEEADKKVAKKTHRISFHEITKTAIEKAVAKPGEINYQLVDAQQARRVLDRLVGYKLSPLLWRKIRRGLSAGRVQSVALRMIVEREREIEKFIPVEYWEIFCRLASKIGGEKKDALIFKAMLQKKNGQKIEVGRDFEAKKIVEELEEAAYAVEAVIKKETRRNPLPPFITSTLQRQAYSRLGFTARRTMRAAQGLYEKGLITYHRTDSVSLSNEAINLVRAYLEKTQPEYLETKPRQFKTKARLAQEAHEAIRPTSFKGPSLEKIKRQDEVKLYELIFKRAVATQMKPAVYDLTKILVRAAGEENVYNLSVDGRINKFLGWLALDGGRAVGGETEVLPAVKKDDELTLKKIDSDQKFTQPPARFNEASLIKSMEAKGIGRPSTYAPTISTIQYRQYVEKIERNLKPTNLGLTVNDFLVEYFPGVIEYEFTAQMEDKLDEIVRGKVEWEKVIGDFFEPFEKKLVSVTKVAERVQIPVEATGEKCPECKDGDLVIKIGKYGKFIACTKFPDCEYKAPFIEKIDGFKCPECKNGEIVIRRTRKGKQFFGCSNWPKCKWASWRKPTEKNPPRKMSKAPRKKTVKEKQS